MKSVKGWFDAYGASHQNPMNKLLHWICVPAVFFSVVVLLAAIPFPLGNSVFLHWGTVAMAVVILFYVRLSPPLAVGISIFAGVCLMGAALLTHTSFPMWAWGSGIFIVAWVGQFIGHHIEGKKPSFLQDIQFLLIGPAWLLGFIYQKFRINY